ncbi:MAG: 16S rRNA (uracil(1498)-N(3))-methyltransferase [Actinomycetota bacterium]|nr:16S rRNA (uracil(1498)-N(3))-methyltransferase [Acidimicrobiia bacterium]MDQ3293751.1 16S rRNA (uracil(1498)-N(3))-methyltransferase [Actinomycetota bacterium]
MDGPDRLVPLVYVDDLDDPVLALADHHHLARVRRLRPGAAVSVGDGVGGWRPARFGERCEPDGPILRQARPEPTLTVAFALTKGDKPEVAVQALTEVGVDRIVPFVAERTVVRWAPDKAARNAARLRAVAREAGMQSRRAWVPEVADVAGFDTIAALAAEGEGAALAHPDGGPPPTRLHTLLIGPEGGWSASEEAAIAGRVRLGPHVLRAATAAVVGGALLVALREASGCRSAVLHPPGWL